MSATDANNNALFFDVQQKTDKQHILDNPDTYIGSVESIDADMWIMSENGNKIVEKNINYIPGLFKLFDEGIVNCRDHVIRMKTRMDNNSENAVTVTHIDISIDSTGTITINTSTVGTAEKLIEYFNSKFTKCLSLLSLLLSKIIDSIVTYGK